MAAYQKPLELFTNLVRVPKLRSRLIFTIFALCVYRIGFSIPVPGIDSLEFQKRFQTEMGGGWAEGLFGIYNTLSAGSIMNFTIFALGIMPYISAEIIWQLLTKVVPRFEEIQKEGESGRQRIKQYSRYTTLGICVLQSAFVVSLLTGNDELFGTVLPGYQATILGIPLFYVTSMVTMCAGSFFLMFLGDKITEKGLGNGVSLIIQAGILAAIPQTMVKMAKPVFSSESPPQESMEYFVALLLLVTMFVAITYGIVQVTLGRREVPIRHQKHTRAAAGIARRQSIPLKVDQAGVIPIIFAAALLVFPAMAFTQLGRVSWMQNTWFGYFMTDIGSAYNDFGFLYEMTYVALIFFFTYFWTQLTFSPPELAKRMREWGAFIPGVRPGGDTVAYLTTVLKRMTLAGAIYLSIVAIVPNLFPHFAGLIFGDTQALEENRLFFRIVGGTGLLIVVSVALDLVQRVEAELVTESYAGYEGGDGGTPEGGDRRRRRQ